MSLMAKAQLLPSFVQPYIYSCCMRALNTCCSVVLDRPSPFRPPALELVEICCNKLGKMSRNTMADWN